MDSKAAKSTPMLGSTLTAIPSPNDRPAPGAWTRLDMVTSLTSHDLHGRCQSPVDHLILLRLQMAVKDKRRRGSSTSLSSGTPTHEAALRTHTAPHSHARVPHFRSSFN